MVERFHYRDHYCSNIFNSSLHPTLDDDRSVAAEVLNAVLNKGVSHIAYLKGINVIPFMRILFAYVNSTSQVRDSVKRDDLKDEDVMAMLRTMFPCNCHLCVHDAASEADAASSTDHAPKTFSTGVTVFTRQNNEVPLPEDVPLAEE